LLLGAKSWWFRLHEKMTSLTKCPVITSSKNNSTPTCKPSASNPDARGRYCALPIAQDQKAHCVSNDAQGCMACVVRRSVSDAGIDTPIECHNSRSTVITDFLINSGRIRVRAKARAGPCIPRAGSTRKRRPKRPNCWRGAVFQQSKLSGPTARSCGPKRIPW
jgi:hypothetical protein